MLAQNRIEARARVIKALPNSVFQVELENGHKPLVYLSGKMKINRITVSIGDTLNKAAIRVAQDIKKIDSPIAQWIASDAIKELKSKNFK